MRHTHRTFSRVLTALLACTPLAGCDDGSEPDESTFRLGSIYQCPRWKCGSNTSQINGKSFQELHLGGQANSDGVALVGFTPPLGLLLGWKLGVEGDELVARGGLFGNGKLRGNQLIGSILLLKLDGVLTLPVIIAGYEQVDSWADNGKPVAAYSLIYADLTQPLLTRSVCKGTLLDPLQASVVVLSGERYDLDDKTVIPGQTNWVTFACAGSAAAKMALLGYGPNAKFYDATPPHGVDERQATLKMLTADYCGDGTSYTEDGLDLDWENQIGTVFGDGLFGSLESFWTADGAVCLDAPRLVDREDVACSLPRCDDFGLDDGEWATYAVGG